MSKKEMGFSVYAKKGKNKIQLAELNRIGIDDALTIACMYDQKGDYPDEYGIYLYDSTSAQTYKIEEEL